MPTANLPIVTVAALCEKVLQEGDRVLSAIRIVDKFIVAAGVPEDGSVPILLTMLLSLKKGESPSGEHTISIKIRRPGGSVTNLEAHRWPTTFGAESYGGVNLIVVLPLKPSESGLHWIDVLFDDQPLTTIPFTLQRQVEDQQPALPESKT